MAEYVGAMDPFRIIHKSLRARLASVAQAAGATDFGDRAAAARFKTAFDKLARFLAHHDEHETKMIHAKLPPAAKCRELAAIEGEHESLGAELESLKALVDDVIGGKTGRAHELYLHLIRSS